MAIPLLTAQLGHLDSFSACLLNPNSWSMYRFYRLPGGIGLPAVKDAAQQIWRIHAALRVFFVRTPDGWRQDFVDPEASAPFRYFDLARIPVDDRLCQLQYMATEMAKTLNITTGPLIRFAYFNVGEPEDARLFFVVHHLVADGHSCEIIARHFDALLEGKKASPPFRTEPTSYAECVDRLYMYAKSDEMRRELEYWRAHPWTSISRIPERSPAHHQDSVRSVRTFSVTVPKDAVRAVRSGLAQTLRPSITEVLLAAFGEALAEWAGGDIVATEVHNGRTLRYVWDVDRPASTYRVEDLVFGRQAAGTVGWFANAGIMFLPHRRTQRPIDYLYQVTESYRARPNNGIGFDILRWIGDPAAVQEIVDRRWCPQVTFNLARSSPARPHAVLRPSSERTFTRPDPMAPMPLCIGGYWEGEDLTIAIDFDQYSFDAEDIAALAERGKANLALLAQVD